MRHTYTIHVVGAGARPQRCSRCRKALPYRATSWPEGRQVGISNEGTQSYLVDERELDEDETLCAPEA